MPPFEILLTPNGYLQIPAAAAAEYFPNDSLVLLVREGEIWLLPTRGPAGGGLMLKQRNPLGDRSVLVWEQLPPGTPPGPRNAFWDPDRGAIRMALDPAPAVELLKRGTAAKARIEPENGRWAVYLDVAFWQPDETSGPLSVQTTRIADYPTRQQAETAASWMERGADRYLPSHPSGF